MWRDEHGRLSWWWIPLGVLFFDLGIIAWVLPAEPVRDEALFYWTAQAFQHAGWFPSLELLRHYTAPQTPLSFYLAGRALSLAPRLLVLRLADCLLMFGALMRFSRFAAQRCGKLATMVVALLALNPYFHLIASHFYTDALAFTLMVMVVTRRDDRLPWLALAGLSLTRQVGMLFAAGEALQALSEKRFRRALVALAALVPALALFTLWRGVFPDTPFAYAAANVHHEYGWLLPYIAAYHLAAFGFYLSPLLGVVPRTRGFWIGVALGALAYALAPAHRNFSAEMTRTGLETLGYLHRGARLLGVLPSHCVLLAFAALGGGLCARCLVVPRATRFFVALFFLCSVFGFQAWDKYLLDVLPAALLAISLAVRALP